MTGEVLTVEDDRQHGEMPVMPVFGRGRRTGPAPALHDIRERCATQLSGPPEALRRLEPTAPYSVRISEAVRDLAAAVDRDAS